MNRLMGGPKGCSHILTLAQLFTSAVMQAAGFGIDGMENRPEGERIFSRSLALDGYESEQGLLQMAIQLTDIHFRHAPEIAYPVERFQKLIEVRGQVDIDLDDQVLKKVKIFDRTRQYENLEQAKWNDRSNDVKDLEGNGLFFGLIGVLLNSLNNTNLSDAPVFDSLLNLPPAFFQSVASLSEDWLINPRKNPTYLGVEGLQDACYMWREESPLMGTTSFAPGTGDIRDKVVV